MNRTASFSCMLSANTVTWQAYFYLSEKRYLSNVTNEATLQLKHQNIDVYPSAAVEWEFLYKILSESKKVRGGEVISQPCYSAQTNQLSIVSSLFKDLSLNLLICCP